MKALVFAFGVSAALFPAIASAGATPDSRDCQTGNARRGECITSSAQPVAPQVTARQTTRMPPPPTQSARNDAQRRRSGKQIPDAELIGPRGAL